MSSVAARRAMNAAETDAAFLYLITLDHPDLPDTLRFVANNEDIVSRGDMYLGYPVEISFPDCDPGQQPKARIRVGAVNDPDDPETDLVYILRNLGAVPPTIGLETVLASDPDVVERSAPGMILTSVDFDGTMIEGDLAYENVLDESYPGDTYSPGDWPGVHA